MNTSKSATYTVAETAELLGIGINQAYQAVRQGDVPSIQIGKRYLVPKAALGRLLDGASTHPKPAA